MSSHRPQGQRQELVFCHQCDNEWHNNGDPTGLTCPNCGSDFTEIINDDFDPRAAQSATSPPSPPQQAQNPFLGLNPWANAPDPDEEDIEGFGHHPQQHPTNPFGLPGTQGVRGGPQYHQPQRQQQQQQPSGNPFQDIFQTIMGRAVGPPFGNNAFPPMPGQQQHHQQEHQLQQQGGQQQSQGQGGFHYTRTGPGYTVTFSNGPFFAMGSGRTGRTAGDQMPPNDMDELLRGLFGSFPGMPGNPGQPGMHPMGPLNFASLFDPSQARAGDAVFSQEALDRVVSQLMEQHATGNAPPGASEDIINQLPKTKLDVEQLDENTGKAECSICMADVDIGEEITTLPCKHWYHFDCIKAWLTEHDTCPVCREGITPKDQAQQGPRESDQPALHDQGSRDYLARLNLARQQSGSRDHPYVLDESPTRARRAPSGQPQTTPQSGQGGEGEGEGITGRIARGVRDWLNGP